MRSRSARSPGSVVISVRRSSPYLSVIAVSSSLMTPRSFTSSARIASSSAIVGRELVVLVAQLLALERGEPAQRHVEDVRRLRLAELERRELQRLPRRVGRLRAADQRDDRVDHVERLQQTLEDVRAVARLVQPVLAAPGDDLDLVRDVHLERLPQVRATRGTPSTSATMFAAKFVCIGVCL